MRGAALAGRALTGVAAGLVGLCAACSATGTPQARPAGGAGPGSPPSQRYIRMGYLPQWTAGDGRFPVRALADSGAAGLLTHLGYAFAAVTADGRCGSGDPWADWERPVPAAQSVDGVEDPADPQAGPEQVRGTLGQLRKLKARHPQLRILIALGGWTGSATLSDATSTPQRRAALARSCVDTWIRGNLPGLAPGAAAGIVDGVDLDWEWPATAGAPGSVARPEDRASLVATLRALRAELDAVRPGLVLSAFLPAAPAVIDAGIDVRGVLAGVDFATVQGYDFAVAAPGSRTGHQANLRPDPRVASDERFSLSGAVRAYLDRGAPAAKLVAGLPAFGRGWAGVDGAGDGDGLHRTATGPAPGPTPGAEPGIAGYRDLAGRPGSRHRDPATGAQWLVDGGEFWSYDDPATIAAKARYVVESGLGGVMFWSLDQDDDRASLLHAASAVLH